MTPVPAAPAAASLLPPTARILSTGSEITQGLYADTNAMEMSRRLTAAGFRVLGHRAAPDDPAEIAEAIAATFGRCEVLVMTGGLGPTEDDLTREILAELWRSPLRRVHRAEAMMRARFAQRGLTMPERNLKQALVPAGARPLLNFWGTAPGLLMPAVGGRPMTMALPGVPHEWRAMWDRYFGRDVAAGFPQLGAVVVHTFHLILLGESTVNQLLLPLFDADPQVDLGLLAGRGVVRVRVVASGENVAAAQARALAFADRIRPLLPSQHVYHEGPEEEFPIERAVVEALRGAQATVSLAESITGGGVARRLTSVPGASAVVMEGAVTYTTAAKARTLGVDPALADRDGGVTPECARAMAEGMLARTGTRFSMAITGSAGPTPAAPGVPVGLVWFAVAQAGGETVVTSRRLPGDRDLVRVWAENYALELLRRRVRGLPTPD